MRDKKLKVFKKLQRVFWVFCILNFSTNSSLLFGQSQEGKLQNEIQKYEILSKEETTNTFVFYQLSRKLLDLHLLRKKEEKIRQDSRFKNFGKQLDTLKNAYIYAQEALQLYRKGSKEEKIALNKRGIASSKVVFNLKEAIAKAAADILLKIPFR